MSDKRNNITNFIEERKKNFIYEYERDTAVFRVAVVANLIGFAINTRLGLAILGMFVLYYLALMVNKLKGSDQ